MIGPLTAARSDFFVDNKYRISYAIREIAIRTAWPLADRANGRDIGNS
jgi:hypothetical protein